MRKAIVTAYQSGQDYPSIPNPTLLEVPEGKEEEVFRRVFLEEFPVFNPDSDEYAFEEDGLDCEISIEMDSDLADAEASLGEWYVFFIWVA